MKQIYKYGYPVDKVKLCKKELCIEARGQNGQLLIAVVAILILSTAAYYLSRIK